MFSSEIDLRTDRLAHASAAETLARLEGSIMLERGRVVVISVAAIRERAGERWKARRDEVWAVLDAQLAACLSPQDIRERLNETDVIIAMPREEPAAVRAVSLRVLEETLLHFLGVAEPADLRLGLVEQIDGTLVTTATLDPTHVPTAWRKGPGGAELGAARSNVAYGEERRRNPICLPARGSDALRVHFTLEPVFSLRHDRVAALRVHPTVSHMVSGAVVSRDRYGVISDDEAAAIDRAALDFAALFLPGVDEARCPIIVPASFRTLGGRRGRRELVSLPDVSLEQTKRHLLIELVDVDRGTPPGRLGEVASLVGAVCRGVFVQLRPGKNIAEPVRDCRLHGLTFDLSLFAQSDAVLTHALLETAAEIKGLTPMVVAHGLPNADFHPIAQVAGFTHAGQRGKAAIDESSAVAA